MIEISNKALVYMVQLVDERMHFLIAKVNALDVHDDALREYEEELLECSQVAGELQLLYEEAEKSSGNMPRYVDLVHK